MRLHHVQVTAPEGGEEAARRFYRDGLGLAEVAKPPPLVGRGGVWFRASDDTGMVTAEIHVGVEEGFRPARKAHPGLLMDTVAVLDATADRLRGLGFEVVDTERNTFPGYVRCHAFDAVGNRVELLAESTDLVRHP